MNKNISILLMSLIFLMSFLVGCPNCEVDKSESTQAKLTKIEITTQPTKKEYHIDDTLDLTGLKVTATYNNGTTADVTANVITSGFDSRKAADSQTIAVTYEGKTATFTVKIKPILTGISITTQPTRKDYHIGDEIDLTGMVVTANYNDGSTKTLASTEYTVTGFDSTAYVNDKVITVTHNDKTDTFKISVVFNWYETPKLLAAGEDGTYGTEGTYVLFGVWPQNVVPEEDVETLGLENSTIKITRGNMELVKGTDENYYVKCAEYRYNASSTDYIKSYKNETKEIGTDGTTFRWFKVMPIKWRVADSEYGSSKGKLLVAENVLTANVPYYEGVVFEESKYVQEKSIRKIDGETVYPNNYMHSQLRAYLNGLNYQGKSTEETKWNGKGFLQTAFTSTAQQSIKTTNVDGIDDKIFLLSTDEVSKISTDEVSKSEEKEKERRIRVATDFAIANKAYQKNESGKGADWFLRSPYSSELRKEGFVKIVSLSGLVGTYTEILNASTTFGGVVPALCISF